VLGEVAHQRFPDAEHGVLVEVGIAGAAWCHGSGRTMMGAFYILEGELIFIFDDQRVSAPPGTFVLVPPGVRHGFRNEQTRPVRLLNIHAPAGFDRRIGLAD
jgi:mannose-6-phosphate isomerase-like protein (cupin superfamily)